VDAAFLVHTTLGPGLLKSGCDTVLAYELAQRGLRTESAGNPSGPTEPFESALIKKDGISVSLMDWKKTRTQRRKGAKNTSKTAEFHVLPV